MKRSTTAATLALIAAIALAHAGSAQAAAKPAGLVGSLAAAECSREKADIGKRAFRKRYGARRGMAKCMSATALAAREAIGVATSACQAELEEWGVEEFLVDWASFEECVSVYADWELDGGLVDDPEADIEADE